MQISEIEYLLNQIINNSIKVGQTKCKEDFNDSHLRQMEYKKYMKGIYYNRNRVIKLFKNFDANNK